MAMLAAGNLIAQSWSPTGYVESGKRIDKFFGIGNNLVFANSSYGGDYGPYELSTNNGTTWTDIPTTLSPSFGFDHELSTPSGVAYGINLSSLVRSTDNYATYEALLGNVNGGFLLLGNNTMLVSAGNIQKSTDNGANWTDTGIDLNIPVGNYKIITSTGRIILSAAGGLQYSDDNGASFNALTNNLPQGIEQEYLHFYKGISNEIYAFQDLNLFKSVDNGANWTEISLVDAPLYESFNPNVEVVDVYESANGTLLLSIWGNPIIMKAPGSSTWVKFVTGTPYNSYNPPGIFSNFVVANGNLFVACEAITDALRIFKIATSSVTSVDEEFAIDIKTYPNPSSSIVNIELPKGYNTVNYKVYNYMGAEVIANSETINGLIKVDLSPFAAGQYILTGNVDGKFFKKQIVKM